MKGNFKSFRDENCYVRVLNEHQSTGDMEPEIDDIDGNKIPLQEWEDMESMLVQEWESICKKKITEAYEEYMKFKNSKEF